LSSLQLLSSLKKKKFFVQGGHLNSLKNINYTDNIILQLARDVDGDEINYIKNTYQKIKTLL